MTNQDIASKGEAETVQTEETAASQDRIPSNIPSKEIADAPSDNEPSPSESEASGEKAGPHEATAETVEESDEEAIAIEEEVIEDPLQVARDENKALREQMLRLAADFDNFRKRSRRDIEDAARGAKMDVLRDLLPVFDNLERAETHAKQATDVQAVATGVAMVIRQFEDIIGKFGVERVKSVGQPFDPVIHEAIQMLETKEQSPGTVMAKVLGGYRWGDRLLRAAMVVVSKAPAQERASGEHETASDTEAAGEQAEQAESEQDSEKSESTGESAVFEQNDEDPTAES